MAMNRTERLTRDVLLFGLIPTWVAAGVVDWWCHRRTRTLGPGYVAGLLGTLAVCLGIPYTEEIVRCTRAALRRRREAAASRTPAPPAPELAETAVEPRVVPGQPMTSPLGGGAHEVD
jgi:hypothetical protein